MSTSGQIKQIVKGVKALKQNTALTRIKVPKVKIGSGSSTGRALDKRSKIRTFTPLKIPTTQPMIDSLKKTDLMPFAYKPTLSEADFNEVARKRIEYLMTRLYSGNLS